MSEKLLDVGYYIEYWDYVVDYLRYGKIVGFEKGLRRTGNGRSGGIDVHVLTNLDRRVIIIPDHTIILVCNPKECEGHVSLGHYKNYPFFKCRQKAREEEEAAKESLKMVEKTKVIIMDEILEWMDRHTKDIPGRVEYHYVMDNTGVINNYRRGTYGCKTS